MDELFDPLLNILNRDDPGEVVGVYLYGSAVSSGLRSDSDIDLLMLTRRSLTGSERAMLVSTLLSISGWKGHAQTFSDVAGRRPVELTSMVLHEAQQATESPKCDFQYGEWLRADLVAGHLPEPTIDPDVVILLATALTEHRVLRGPALDEIVPGVSTKFLRRAVMDKVPEVLQGLQGDERNTLLTLARSVVTLNTGRIVAKDAAVDAVAPMLEKPDRSLLQHAQQGYLGTAQDDWTGLDVEVALLAETLTNMIAKQDEHDRQEQDE